MSPDEARALIRRMETVPPESPDLIGYEPQSHPVDVSTDDGACQLATHWSEATRIERRVLVVRERNGRLTLWQETHVFWTQFP